MSFQTPEQSNQELSNNTESHCENTKERRKRKKKLDLVETGKRIQAIGSCVFAYWHCQLGRDEETPGNIMTRLPTMLDEFRQ